VFKRKTGPDAHAAHCLLKDVGVNRINRQHLRLASYAVEFNEIVDGFADNEPDNQDWRRVDALFNRVMRFVETHFSEEEALMREHGYPGFEAHKQIHDRFIEELIKVKSQINNRDPAFRRKFGPMLWNWLMHHINEEDYKYREFFRGKGIT
jgi:hemerythrin-like metal-binding protein